MTLSFNGMPSYPPRSLTWVGAKVMIGINRFKRYQRERIGNLHVSANTMIEEAMATQEGSDLVVQQLLDEARLKVRRLRAVKLWIRIMGRGGENALQDEEHLGG